METRAENKQSESASNIEQTPFRLVVIYDSEAAKSEAASASDFILRELGEEILVEKTFWNVRSLGILDVQDRAINHAADADVILLALSVPEAPEELKIWAESWLKLRSSAEGLLAVIPTGSKEVNSSDLVEYFYETAVSANMDFICRNKQN